MSPGLSGRGVAASYRPHEIVLAVALAVAVEGLALIGLRSARHPRASSAPDPGPMEAAIPVRAVALQDPAAPLLKRGGGGGGAPRARTTPAPREEQARPVPAAAERALSERDQAKAAPQDSVAPAEDPAASSANEADPPAGTAAEGATGATDKPPGPGGEGHLEGSPEGTEADPLKARAVDLYRSRIIAWFSGRFRVSGSGLPREELERLRVTAIVTISSDRRIVSYAITPSGSAPFDAAARAALESTVGSSIPAPPESYPGIVQTSIHVTFVCRRDQCD
ncbi:MAG TPA: energy transducer TonB [Polyangiaceae bacterium]|nr:energy transducer TonB [Polyangiaceae bacterium]